MSIATRQDWLTERASAIGASEMAALFGEGFETPWHQDGHYWPIRPLATCTVWVALEESKIGNGCLRVIPGSHQPQALYEHLHEDRTDLTLNQRMAPGTFDEAAAVDVELEPGQMSLHDVYMIHGAAANRSPQRRTGVALRLRAGARDASAAAVFMGALPAGCTGAPRALIAQSSGSQRVTLVTQPAIDPAAVASLAGVSELRNDGGAIRFRTDRPTETLKALAALIAEQRLELVELQVKKASLEDVFVGLTKSDETTEVRA